MASSLYSQVFNSAVAYPSDSVIGPRSRAVVASKPSPECVSLSDGIDIPLFPTFDDRRANGTDQKQAASASWFMKLKDELAQMACLPRNWDEEGAQPPNKSAIFWAGRALEFLYDLNFPPTYISPSVEEGVGISFYREKASGGIEFFNSGEVVAVTSDGTNPPSAWEVGVSDDEIASTLKRIHGFLSGY